MSRGDLQEMEASTKQSKTAVNAGAKPAEPMDTSLAGTVEDLGGPTSEIYTLSLHYALPISDLGLLGPVMRSLLCRVQDRRW